MDDLRRRGLGKVVSNGQGVTVFIGNGLGKGWPPRREKGGGKGRASTDGCLSRASTTCGSASERLVEAGVS